MRSRGLLSCCWPGGRRVWRQGDWWGLLPAVGFACLLNLGLAASWVWTELLPNSAVWAIWSTLIVVWALSVFGSLRTARRLGEAVEDVNIEATFREAQREYLRGHWLEAERLLQALLAAEPDDAEGWLLAAAVARRQGRMDLAAQSLGQADRCTRGPQWSLEIARERRRIEQDVDSSGDERSGAEVGVEPATDRGPEGGESSPPRSRAA